MNTQYFVKLYTANDHAIFLTYDPDYKPPATKPTKLSCFFEAFVLLAKSLTNVRSLLCQKENTVKEHIGMK